MSTDTPEVKDQEVPAKKDDTPLPVQTPALDDYRASIYAKSDALRHPKPAPPEEEAEVEPEAEPEKPEEPAKEPEKPEEEKPAGEPPTEEPKEDLSPREKRKLENLEAKEKRLSVWEKKLVDQFNAADKPPIPKTDAEIAATPLRHLTEEQIQSKFDELSMESAYKATKFLKEVDSARDSAMRESEDKRIDTDFRDFKNAYKDVSEADWIRMNDPSFYEKYPDILQAMERRNHYAAFVAARGRLVEERLSAEREAERTRETAREAEIRKRNELKKKGTVLRVQTKVEQPIRKDEAPKTPDEIRRQRVADMVAASKARQGL